MLHWSRSALGHSVSISPRKLSTFNIAHSKKRGCEEAAGRGHSEVEAVPPARGQSGSSTADFGALAVPREEYSVTQALFSKLELTFMIC